MSADRISVAELQELLAAHRLVTVLGVRSPSDVDSEIPGAIHMDAYAELQSGRLGPLADLSPAQGPIVTVCGVGRTAGIATERGLSKPQLCTEGLTCCHTTPLE